MRKIYKRAALRVMKSAGLFALAKRSSWRTARLAILCYHGVSIGDEHLWDPSLYMSAETLDRRMGLLRDHGYQVVPLQQGISRLYNGTLAPKSVSITFDDGNHDFYQRAVPVLARYGFPATVYLTTYYSTFNGPVFSVFCSYLLWKAGPKAIQGVDLVGAPRHLDFATPEGRLEVLTAINQRAEQTGWSASDKDAIARQLARKLDVDADPLYEKRVLHIMKPSQVAECADAGMDIELHTHRHRTPLDSELFKQEIQENRQRIHEMTGRRATHFCYPNGILHRSFEPWLREAGVESATTCVSGLAAPTSDPLLLPRIVDTSNLDDLEFESWISGTMAWLRVGT